jgi:hypothetical protein
MTAEVAIMNQHALVLAADSATTVTMWVQGERQTRYFKGANKLFQLSAKHPVGLMIYSSASLHDVPWELLVKDFRNHLGTDSCDRLVGYSKRFFEFVKAHATLFPDDVRAQLFADQARTAAFRMGHRVAGQDSVKGAVEADRPAAVQAALESLRAELRATPPEAPVVAADVDAAVAAHAESVAAKINEERAQYGVPTAELALLLADVAIRDLMVHYKSYLSETGVVLGGYGDYDYYPGIEAFECYGFLDRQFICNPTGDPTYVSKDLPAAIEPFATTSMINTFRMGIGPDIFGNVVSATKTELRGLENKIRQALAPDADLPNLEAWINEAAENHQKQWFYRSISDHYGPLAKVIGSLPVSEMAALAKSLIELQSLKERVTQPTESVAGPIDVAVISKHDGFVWIERKHYFKPELNPRFFRRQSSLNPS